MLIVLNKHFWWHAGKYLRSTFDYCRCSSVYIYSIDWYFGAAFVPPNTKEQTIRSLKITSNKLSKAVQFCITLIVSLVCLRMHRFCLKTYFHQKSVSRKCINKTQIPLCFGVRTSISFWPCMALGSVEFLHHPDWMLPWSFANLGGKKKKNNRKKKPNCIPIN